MTEHPTPQDATNQSLGRLNGLSSDDGAASVSTLRASIPDADAVLMTHAGPAHDGGFEFAFRDGEENGILHIIATGLADMMQLDSDKPLNCVQLIVQPAGKPQLTLTMQRAGGKTPLMLKSEATKLLRDTLAAIDTGRSEPMFIVRDQIRNWLEDDPAQAIEARRAETSGSARESAVRQDAPNISIETQEPRT